jgi:hypothetical protein
MTDGFSFTLYFGNILNKETFGNASGRNGD